MTREATDRQVERHVHQLHLNAIEWESAVREDDEKEIERAAGRADEHLKALARTEAGRNALERLLPRSSPGLTLGIAATVMKWAPEKAVPALAALLHDPLDPAAVSWEKAGIRMNARILLTDYFGLRLDETMPLPGLLAEMGIEIPEELSRELRRLEPRMR